MDKIVREQIRGELLREGKPPINVKLDITAMEKQADQKTTPIKRIPQKVDFSSGTVVEDGDCILRFTFDGQQVEEKKRVQGGKLYAR